MTSGNSKIPPNTAPILDILGLTNIVNTRRCSWTMVTPEARHSIWRLNIADNLSTPSSYIVKSYHQESDDYFAHRFRREERILDLFGRYGSDLVPIVYGGIFVRDQSAHLILEDLGDHPLHIELHEASRSQRRHLLSQAVDLLIRFHRLADRYSPIIRAICRGAILDRINTETLVRKFAVAQERLGLPMPINRAREIRSAMREFVIRPLLNGPSRPIHNSFSPLNLCAAADGSLRVIDMETISIGPAALDLAELLIYPGQYICDVETELRQQYSSGMDREAGAGDLEYRVELAAIARAIDYAGTLSSRSKRFQDAGLEELSGFQNHRRASYLVDAFQRAQKIPLPTLLTEFIEQLNNQFGSHP